MKQQKAKKTMICVRLTDELKKELDRISEEREWTLSYYVERTLRNEVEKERQRTAA